MASSSSFAQAVRSTAGGQSLHRDFGVAYAPQAKSSDKRVTIASEAHVAGQLFQLFAVAAAEDNIVGTERCDQFAGDLEYISPPFLFSEPAQPAQSEVILIGLAVLIGKMGELHGLHGTIDDHSRSQAGTQAEEEHAASAVASNGLHDGIVHQFHRAPKGAAKIESYPAAAKIVRFAEGQSVRHGAGIADGDEFVVPVFGGPLDVAHHLFGRHARAGGNLAGLGLPGSENLYVGAANVDHQDFGVGAARRMGAGRLGGGSNVM